MTEILTLLHFLEPGLVLIGFVFVVPAAISIACKLVEKDEA